MNENTSREHKMNPSLYVPYDSTNYMFCTSEGGGISSRESAGLHPFEYTGWWDECLSWHENCYIHAGLNPIPTYKISGPDAKKMLEKYCVNTFENFPVGKGKHAISLSSRGYIASDGVLLHTAEDEYLSYWLWPRLGYAIDSEKDLDVTGENLTGKVFCYQLCGPRSLEIIEAATQQDLHDLPFIHFCDATICGKPIFILRIGMAGSLAYEIHGNVEDALDVYNAVLQAGEPYGIRRLGRHAYRNTHTEGGFPQSSLHFWLDMEPDYLEYIGTKCDTWGGRMPTMTGSMEPVPERCLRTPYDLDWGKMVKFDHDFIGREALEELSKEPPHKMVTLEWDEEDIIDIWKSVFPRFRDKPYKLMTGLVEDEHFATIGDMEYSADKVLKDGKFIGISSGRCYSPFYGKSISLCTIDKAQAEVGNEVIILWGDYGSEMKEVHARVGRYPYVNESRNQTADLTQIPRLQFK